MAKQNASRLVGESEPRIPDVLRFASTSPTTNPETRVSHRRKSTRETCPKCDHPWAEHYVVEFVFSTQTRCGLCSCMHECTWRIENVFEVTS